ncbi:MAG: hypothetical protein HC799_02260 [Limnothrix sp. RL_2_0]|nr:hypothetical protein [Limnothrix sp. RL_2_0]
MWKQNEIYIQAIVLHVTKRAADKAHTWRSHPDLDTYCYLRHGVRDAKRAFDIFDIYFSTLKQTSITQESPINIDSQTILKSMLQEIKKLRSCYRNMPGDDGIYQDMSVAIIEEDLKKLIETHYQPSKTELDEATAYLETIKRDYLKMIKR